MFVIIVIRLLRTFHGAGLGGVRRVCTIAYLRGGLLLYMFWLVRVGQGVNSVKLFKGNKPEGASNEEREAEIEKRQHGNAVFPSRAMDDYAEQ